MLKSYLWSHEFNEMVIEMQAHSPFLFPFFGIQSAALNTMPYSPY